MDIKYFFYNLIEEEGLFYSLKITGTDSSKILSIGIEPEYLTRKIKQEFIQDYFKDLGYGVSLPEIDVDPIFWSQNDDDYREIFYIGVSKVSIIVWEKETNDSIGEYGVLYYNLSDDMIDEIFDIVVKLYDDNFYI